MAIDAHEKPVLEFDSIYSQKVFVEYFKFLKNIDLQNLDRNPQLAWIAEFIGSKRPAKDKKSLATFCESRINSSIKSYGKFRRKWIKDFRISDLLRVKFLDFQHLQLGHFKVGETYFQR